MPTESEQSLAKRLAHTDKSVRDEAFTMVGNWLESQLLFDDAVTMSTGEKDEEENEKNNELHLEMLKFWKALFYCVWMSDKPAVQMELVGKVAQLMRIFCKHEGSGGGSGALAVKGATSKSQKKPSAGQSLSWSKRAECGIVFQRCFFETLTREWAGLDRYRIDKFLSLIRRMLHEALRFCSDTAANDSSSSTISTEMTEWELKSSTGIATVINEVMSASSTPNGIRLHIADIFIDELMSALAGRLHTPLLLSLLVPMSNVLRSSDSLVLFERVATAVWSGCAPGGVRVGSGSGLLWRVIDQESKASTSSSSFKSNDHDHQGIGKARGKKAENEEKEEGAAILRINTATFARFMFSIGADPSTRSSQRGGVYALHKEWAVEAIKLGHAKSEAETYPEGGMAMKAAAAATAVAATAGGGNGGLKKRGRAQLLQGDKDDNDNDDKDEVGNSHEEEEADEEEEEDEEEGGAMEVKKAKKKRVRQKDRAIKVEEKEHKVGKPRGLKSAAKSKKKYNRRLRK